MYQIDKNLGITFGKSFNEFYSSPDAAKMIASQPYKEAMAKAIYEQNAIFSRLLKVDLFTRSHWYGSRTSRDMRKIPVAGLFVPLEDFLTTP